VPSGQGFVYSLQVATTTASGSTPLVEQRIEAANVSDLVSGKTVTVSFWASQTSGTLMPLQIGLFVPTTTKDTFGAQTQTGSTVTTATLTGTLTYYTATFTLTTVGTLTTTTNNGLALRFISGATASACTFLITGVQLEKGSIATPFEFRPFGTELRLCQRYYCKTFPLDTVPAAGVGQTGSIIVQGCATTTIGFAYDYTWMFPVNMRAAPTIATYNPSNAGGGSTWYDGGGGSIAAGNGNLSTGSGIIYNSGTAVAGRNAVIHATADAELIL
jgi:hypothetical protein